jgi:hypothetical protein
VPHASLSLRSVGVLTFPHASPALGEVASGEKTKSGGERERRAGLKPGPYKTLGEDYRFAPKASRRPSNVKSSGE